MSRLYEGETIEMYDPFWGGATQAHVQQEGDDEWLTKALQDGRAADELLNSAGWKLLKERVDGEVATLKEKLVDVTEPGTIARLQAAIKVYANFEGFINRYVLEGQLALKESEQVAQDNSQED